MELAAQMGERHPEISNILAWRFEFAASHFNGMMILMEHFVGICSDLTKACRFCSTCGYSWLHVKFNTFKSTDVDIIAISF